MKKNWLIIAVLLVGIILIFSSLAEAGTEGRPCIPEPTDMPIDYGDVINCAIDEIGDTDTFRFIGIDGEVIVMQATRQTDFMEPCIQLYFSGTPVAEACSSSSSERIDVTLGDSGEYTILVWDWFNDETGGYGLVLERIVPFSPSALPIQYGESISGLMIDPVGDLDSYFFAGDVGDAISLQVSRQGGYLEPCVQLFAPDGILIKEACSSSSSERIDVTLVQTGDHTILVWDWFNDEAGEYGLTLQCLSGPCSPSSLTLSPTTGFYVSTQGFDLVLIVDAPGLSVVGGSAILDGQDVTAALARCVIPGTLVSGGRTFRCPDLTGGRFGTGTHTLSVTLDLSDDSSISDTVTWEVKENTEP